MTFRNVDGSPEMLESGSAQLYLRILLANSGKRQRGLDSGQRHQPKTAICKKAGTLGSILSVCILCFTVVSVLAIGILSAYASVIGILHTFASQSPRRSEEKPVLAPQARAAHAGGS